MKITKNKTTTTKILERIVCDICGKSYDFNMKSNDIYEASEFICIQRTGGYSSIFGDGDEIKVDICQHCFKELIMDKKVKK